MATKYHDTPIGTLSGYLHILEPDTKYKPEGEFKAQQTLTGAEAAAQKARVDAAVDEAFDAHMAELRDKGEKPGELKKWAKHYPYEELEDDEGEKTGEIEFKYRQNATLKSKKTGETIKVKPMVQDAMGKDMHSKVFGGSTGRIRYSMRPAVQTSSKKVGVRLDFAGVQVVKMADRQGGGGGGFGQVEGGYSEEEAAEGFGQAPSSGAGSASGGADY